MNPAQQMSRRSFEFLVSSFRFDHAYLIDTARSTVRDNPKPATRNSELSSARPSSQTAPFQLLELRASSPVETPTLPGTLTRNPKLETRNYLLPALHHKLNFSQLMELRASSPVESPTLPGTLTRNRN